MLLMVEKGIIGGICHAMHRYANTNNNYMKKSYDKNIEPSYLMYLDANNLYRWALSQKMPANGFKWIKNLTKFDEDFIENYDENSNKGYILEVDVEYLKNIFNRHGVLPFLAERNKIKKYKKLACNINHKENCFAHIRALKQALNQKLMIKKSTG